MSAHGGDEGGGIPNPFLMFFEWLAKKLGMVGANVAVIYSFFGILALGVILLTTSATTNHILVFIVATAPLWLPYILFWTFYDWWMLYVQTHFNIDQGRVSLEIILPQDIFKSPAAMEAALSQWYQTASADNLVQVYWDGKNPQKMGLEIISTGGKVRFIVNCARKKIKNMVENQLYAQFPGIEIKELPIDYTAEVQWDPSRFEVFSLHFRLDKADPYPIRSYMDYELDKDTKEEEQKIDPLSPMFEFLSSLGPGEHLWVQYLIRPFREENFETGSLESSPSWTKLVQAEIAKILTDPKTKERKNMMQLTDTEKKTVLSMERRAGKYSFKTYVRMLYVAEKAMYKPGERIGQMITSLFAFNDLSGNSFKLAWRTDFNWNWWQDPSGVLKEEYKKAELKDYKKRKYEYRNSKDHGMVFSTEELATLFHFPGAVVSPPGLSRIPSTRGEPPQNLPT